MALCGENRQDGEFMTESVPMPDSSIVSDHSSKPKWFKQWVPCDTVLNPGKLMVLKWVTDDIVKSLKEKTPEEVKEPEDEYEVLYLCTHSGCGKAFSEQGALRKHMNIHGERQFVCHYEGCGKRFMDSSKLKRHFLIHTGERHFVCPVDGCGKAFSLDFNLRSHMRTHTQENYHVCPFEDCGKRYAHEYKLRAHLRQYHEKVIPPDVKLGPPPPLPASLEREIRMQKSAVAAASANHDRPFACPHRGCGKRYIHEYKLNLHLRKEHASDNRVEPGRGGWHGDAEDDVDEDSDRELMRSSRGSGRGKTRLVSKVITPKSAKSNKWQRPPQVDFSSRMQSGFYPGRQREIMRKSFHGETDDSEEEDQDGTDDENVGRMVHTRTLYQYEDDDEMDDDDDDDED